MTGTITGTADLTNRRIGVQLSAWAAADGPVIVKRVHPDTTEWTVRGFGNTSGGQAFVYDYEAPFNTAVTYYAFDGATKVTSSSTTLAVSTPMLRAPGLPAYDMVIEPLSKPASVTRGRPSVVLQPLGRETPIVLTDARKSAAFSLATLTRTDADALNLLSLMKQASTCLLLLPGTRMSWQYVAVLNHTEAPLTRYKLQSGAAADDPANWSQWTLDCIVVDPPVGGIFGDPTASYAAVVSNYATYAALKTAKATYLDVLKGVP